MSPAPRYLFVTWEGGGNVPPVLGAARRLVARGCEVRVLGEPCMQAAVEAIGAAFSPFSQHFLRTDATQPLLRDFEAGNPLAALVTSLRDVVLGPAAAVASDTARVLDAHGADVLVVDWLMPGALPVGQARGLPTAVLFHCVNSLPGPGRPVLPTAPATGPLSRLRDHLLAQVFHWLANRHAGAFAEVRRGLGLPALDRVLDQFLLADRVLVQTTPEFDFRGAPDPDNLVYVGPILDDPPWIGPAGWTSPWPDDDRRPLALLSLSTTFQDQQGTLQQAIEALGRLDVRGLVTLGPAMAARSFSLPDNVVAVGGAPHGAILPQVDVFLTHCGHGSTMRALSHGVPLVALPMGRDQDATARRITFHGLGLQPRRSPAAIARAVRTVLDQPAFREAARRMARHIHRDVEADATTRELLALAPMQAAASGGGALAG